MTADQQRQREHQEKRRLRRQTRARGRDGGDLVTVLRTKHGKAVRLVKIGEESN